MKISLMIWNVVLVAALLLFSGTSAHAVNSRLADTVWLEPLRFGAYFRGENDGDAPTKQDVVHFVRELQKAGFSRIVVAYSTLFKSVLFEDRGERFLPDYYYYHINGDKLLDATIVSTLNSNSDSDFAQPLIRVEPNNGQSSVNGTFIVDVLINAANEIGMDVILGLSSAGDKNLLFDYGLFVSGDEKDMFVQHSNISIYHRISANNLFNMYLADFFVEKFGDKITGFYLTQEANCLDQAMKYHWSVIATHIKQSALSAQRILPEIWVSPVVSAATCGAGQSLEQVLTTYASSTGSRSIGSAPLIDVVMYQDGAGAASLPTTVGGVYEKYWFNLAYDPLDGTLPRTAREERINRSSHELSELKEVHTSAGALDAFFINLEAWEMNGYCSGVEESPAGLGPGVLDSQVYGCPYSGEYDRIYSQTKKYMNELSIGSDKLMLNEGGLLFDFSMRIGSPPFSSSFPLLSRPNNDKKAARCFTQQYINDNAEIVDQCVD